MCKCTSRRAAWNPSRHEHQKLDTVEGSNPSKTENETMYRRGAGNVELPASPARVNEDRMNVKSEQRWTMELLEMNNPKSGGEDVTAR
jgi:hypothetical protein